MARPKTPAEVETEVLVRSRRWCALCFGLSFTTGPRKGQIAHVDRDSSRTGFDDLCWLCFEHHDEYDSTTRQSKGITPSELRRHRSDLYSFLEGQRRELVAPPRAQLSPHAIQIIGLLQKKSRYGRHLDAQIRVDSISDAIGISKDDVDIAVDELRAGGIVVFNGTGEIIFTTDRFFWETDPLFTEADPVLDAEVIARELVQHSSDQMDMSALALRLGWTERRLNPASTYLADRGFAEGVRVIANTFWTPTLWRTAATKRLVRDLDARNAVVPRST